MLQRFLGHSARRGSTLLAGFWGSLAGSLLTATATGQASVPVAQPPQLGQPMKRSLAPRVTFHWHAGRLLTTIDPALLDTDFRLTAGVTAVSAPLPTAAHDEASGAGPAPVVGAQRASGALRLRQVGDSLVISEYVGGAGQGRLHYRRRGATPVLQVLAGRGVVIDAAPLWATLEPDRTGPNLFGRSTQRALWVEPVLGSAPAATLPPHPSSPAPFRDMATVAWRLGDRVVTYAVDAFRLPKVPMRPRIADRRIPWLTDSVPWIDSTTSGKDSTRLTAIRRFRLEKQDTAAPVSDVVQPILADLSEVPEPWVPYFKASIGYWNHVLASVGFRRAIQVLLPGESLPADSTVPVMKFFFQEGVSSAYAVRRDPRSGEILESRVDISSQNPLSHLKLMYRMMFGSRDSRVKPGAPLPDSIVGLLLSAVVSHEMGHSLGLQHNFQLDGYATDSLRRPDFVRRMRFAPSVMGYSSINYVAQPEDHVPLEHLVLWQPGPYDEFALGWGYRPIPGVKTPREELPILERWRAVQDSVPYLRADVKGEDETLRLPYYEPEALGGDLLKSMGYGLRNLTLSVAAQKSRDADERGGVIIVWSRLLALVRNLIGGEVPRGPYPSEISQTPRVPIDSAYQLQAMRFLYSHVFYGQDALIPHLIPARRPGDSTLVLFDELLPEWEDSQIGGFESAKQALRTIQERAVTKVVKALPSLARQKQFGTLAGVCQELVTLERRLGAARAVSSEGKEHVSALSALVSKAFKPLANTEAEESAESAAKQSPAEPPQILCTK